VLITTKSWIVFMIDYENCWSGAWDDMTCYGAACRHRHKIIAHLVGQLPHGKVLDLGCGNGSLLYKLSLMIDGKFSGADVASSGLALAKRNNPTMDFALIDLSKEFQIEPQDVVILSEVLEHIKDDELVLKIIARLTRYVVISVPGGAASKLDHLYGHLRSYGRDQLRAKMENCNFEVICFFRWGWPFFDWMQWLSNAMGGDNVMIGHYGKLMKMVAEMLYLLYYLNIPNRGTQIFAVGKSRSYLK
jgi:SAM-dependent methyltransferase